MQEVGCGKQLVFVWGSRPPVFSIGYELPSSEYDSGFTVLFDDAPDPEEIAGPDDPRLSTLCLHCLIEDYPEVGHGLDLARDHGAADLIDGEWRGRAVSE